MRPAATAVLGLITLTFAQGGVAGGPLTPPAGPVLPTPGPEPRVAVNDLPGSAIAQHVISAPGSYYFSGDILVTTAGLHGVYIDTPGPVTIDGMGFSIRGVPGTLNAFVMFDNTGVPLRAKVQNMHSAGFEAWAVKWVGPSDSNSPEEDHVAFEDIDVLVSGSSGVAVFWHGDITLKRGYIDNGGIFQADGRLTISDSTISGNSAAPAIEADGLFMTNVETRGGEGVVAKKPKEIVVVGSKVKEVVRGVAFSLAEGAVVTDSQADGTVDADDFVLWQRNYGMMDFNDPDVVATTFGRGSRVEDSVWVMLGPLSSGEHAIECAEEVAFYYNKIAFQGTTGTPNALIRFSTGRSTIAHNIVQGIPAGAAGFEMHGILNTVHNNEFFGRGLSSVGVSGTAARSVFRNNTMMDIGTPFSLSGAGLNYIGPMVNPFDSTPNSNPDRNLRIPPLDPVR